MILPPFEPPKYDELRAWWRQYPLDDVRRLILEIQNQRYFVADLSEIARRCRSLTEDDRPLVDRMAALNQLNRGIEAQQRRAGRVYGSPPTRHPNAPNFRKLWGG